MIQDFLQLPVVTLARVMLGVALAFVVMPALALPRPTSARTGLDAVVVRSIRWIGLVLVVSHLLVVVRLFHVAPISLLWIWLYLWNRSKHVRVGSGSLEMSASVTPIQLVWLKFVDLMHVFERSGVRAPVDWIAGVGVRARESVTGMFTMDSLRLVILLAPVVGILGVSLGLRVDHAFRFETLSPPDAYVYLTWAKEFASNRMFVDGIYPHGFPAFIAFLGKLSPGIDLYEIVRYTGAVIGMMLVFGVFYAVLRLTANVGAALFASGVFGLFGTVYEWHAPWIRQTGPLPQELGFAIALFALPCAILAVTERDADHLRTALFAAVGIGMIHPVPLVFFGVLAVAGALGASLAERRSPRMALGVFVTIVAGGIIAHLYVPIALISGVGVFRGLDQPFSFANIPGSRSEHLVGMLGTSAIGHNRLSLLAGAGALVALIAGFLVHRRQQNKHLGAQMVGLGFVGLAAFAFYDVLWIDLPVNIIGPLGNLAGIAATLGLAAGFAGLTAWGFRSRRPALRTSAFVVAAAIAVAAFGATFEGGPRAREPSEYPQMAAVTRSIMRNHDAFTYTMVGTPQQRQAVTGIGTFVELWVFARDVTVRDAQDPGFVVPDLSSLMFARDLGQQLPIPTTHVYIFVEKEPFPVPEAEPVGPAEEYYYNREKRGRIMATVYGWAEFYRHYHTDMQIHYEDDEIIVYEIRRRPNPVAAAVSPQFKDYSWEPGELFTGGLSHPSEVVIPWHD